MNQAAVFVDVGYLIAEGARLLTGGHRQREHMRLDVDVIVDDLREQAASIEGADRLLRIYWYDGLARGGRLTLEQQRIAQSRDVKARFGRINMQGEQKGVDSLIVTDLIDLARDHSISDALILAGDEDLRVGLEKAQSHGVRIHLLGIAPIENNQSVSLLNEADTSNEWGIDRVERWLMDAGATPFEPTQSDPAPAFGKFVADVVREQVEMLTFTDVQWLLEHTGQNKGKLPREFDAPSLAMLGKRVARLLSEDERKTFRAALRQAVEARRDHSAHGS